MIRFFRGVFRYNILVVISLGFIAAFLLTSILNRKIRTRCTLFLILVFFFEYLPVKKDSYNYRLEYDQPSAPYSKIKEEESIDVVLEYPVENPRNLLYGTLHWKPQYYGLAGYSPPGYGQNFETLASLPQPRAVSLLDSLGIQNVVVHGDEHCAQFEASAYFSELKRSGSIALFRLNPGAEIPRFAPSRRRVPGIGWDYAADNPVPIPNTNDLATVKRLDESIVTFSNGIDPHLRVPVKYSFSSRDYTTLLVRMRLEGPLKRRGIAALYWTSDTDNTFDEEKTITWLVDVDGEFHTYTFDLAKSFQWMSAGKITRIFLKPVDDILTYIEIDYVRLR